MSRKVDEPQLKAMFETSAEVLGGLVKAFRDYEQKALTILHAEQAVFRGEWLLRSLARL
jgi:hypothetical protein